MANVAGIKFELDSAEYHEKQLVAWKHAQDSAFKRNDLAESHVYAGYADESRRHAKQARKAWVLLILADMRAGEACVKDIEALEAYLQVRL